MVSAQSLLMIAAFLCNRNPVSEAFQSLAVPVPSAAQRRAIPPSTSSLSAAMVGAMTPGSGSASFEQRMRHMVTTETEKVHQHRRSTTSSASSSTLPNGVRQVKSLKEYTQMIDELVNVDYQAAATAPMTVVRFHSSYCPSCKRSLPFYNRIMRKFQDAQQNGELARGINWIEVEVNRSNADLQKALGLQSIPTGLMYHPQAGLVEKMSFGKKNLLHMERTLQSYVNEERSVVKPLEEAVYS